jgi:hypothetical protein
VAGGRLIGLGAGGVDWLGACGWGPGARVECLGAGGDGVKARDG